MKKILLFLMLLTLCGSAIELRGPFATSAIISANIPNPLNAVVINATTINSTVLNTVGAIDIGGNANISGNANITGGLTVEAYSNLTISGGQINMNKNQNNSIISDANIFQLVDNSNSLNMLRLLNNGSGYDAYLLNGGLIASTNVTTNTLAATGTITAGSITDGTTTLTGGAVSGVTTLAASGLISSGAAVRVVGMQVTDGSNFALYDSSGAVNLVNWNRVSSAWTPTFQGAAIFNGALSGVTTLTQSGSHQNTGGNSSRLNTSYIDWTDNGLLAGGTTGARITGGVDELKLRTNVTNALTLSTAGAVFAGAVSGVTTLGMSGDLSLADGKYIKANTSDASDNALIGIVGGGANGASRGGAIWVCGNEYTTDIYKGAINLRPGVGDDSANFGTTLIETPTGVDIALFGSASSKTDVSTTLYGSVRVAGDVSATIAGASVAAVNPTNQGVHAVGDDTVVSVADNETFTMTIGNGGLFTVTDVSNGKTAVFAFSYLSATITKISDVDAGYEITDTDTSKIAVFKSINSSVISVKNYTNGTINVYCQILGDLTAATAPS